MIKITIEKVSEVEKLSSSYEKVADTGNERDGKAVYDYVPYKEFVTKTVTILEQTITDETQVDISAIIKAINKI